jgi:hypothetical protein
MTFVLDQRLANQGAFGVTKAIYNAEGLLIKRVKIKNRTRVFLPTDTIKANC